MTINLPQYVKATCLIILIICGFTILVYASDILITLSIAMFLSFLLLPVSKKLEQLRFPQWLAILSSILMAIVIFGALIFFFTYQLLSFRQDIPKLEKSLNQKIAEVEKYIEKSTHISRKKQTRWLNTKVTEWSSESSQTIVGMFSATGEVLGNAALIPIYIFFLTLYREKFLKFTALIFNANNHENFFMIAKKVSLVSQKYIKGILIDITILTALNSAGFLLLGLEQAVLFGALAAILNIIPYIGVLIGSVFPIAMALLTKDSMWYAVGAAGVCVIVQFIDNNFITPKVVGSSVSVNPLTATIALLIGAKMWGIMGMILFIPFAGMIKVLFDNIESLKPYGYLLGEEKDIKTIPKEEAEEIESHAGIIKKIVGQK